jgi:hypothetical protein
MEDACTLCNTVEFIYKEKELKQKEEWPLALWSSK